MNRWIAVCAAAGMVCSQACFGGTLKKEDIPPDAKWVVHIDMERLLASEIGKLVTDETTNERLRQRMAAAVEKVGFHPLKDLTGVTLYGQSIGSRQGILLLRGGANLQASVEKLRADKSHEEISYGNRVIYKKTGPEGKRCLVAHYHRSGAVIIGGAVESVERAIDALDGKAAGSAEGGARSVPDLPPDSFFMAWSESLGKGASVPPHAVALRNSRKGTFTMGESAGDFRLDISLTAGSPKKGELIRQMMSGARAYIALRAEESSIGKLVEATKIEGSGDAACVKMSYPSTALYDILKSQKGRLCRMFHRPRHGRTVPADADSQGN